MPSKLDHMMQYQVEKISTHDKKPAIIFENGAKIILDEKPKAIEDVAGARLKSVEDKGELGEQLFFTKGQAGVDQVEYVITLDKGEYKIFDPATKKLVDPNVVIDPNEGLPPEPIERLAEGPTTQEESGGDEGKEKAGATE